MSDPASTAEQVDKAYREYIEAFNKGDVEGAVRAYAFPYFDITNIDGVPTTMLVSEEECRQYFTENPDSVTDEQIAVTIDQLTVQELAPGIAHAYVAVTRRTIAGADLGSHQNWYTYVRRNGAWLITGYVSDYPRVS
jgi:hypothetical protein